MKIHTKTYQSKSNAWNDLKVTSFMIKINEQAIKKAYEDENIEAFLSCEKRLGKLYQQYMKLL